GAGATRDAETSGRTRSGSRTSQSHARTRRAARASCRCRFPKTGDTHSSLDSERAVPNGKRPLAAAVMVRDGGGGENRTRVRKPSTVGTTCLVSSFGSRLPVAHGQAAGKPVTLV